MPSLDGAARRRREWSRHRGLCERCYGWVGAALRIPEDVVGWRAKFSIRSGALFPHTEPCTTYGGLLGVRTQLYDCVRDGEESMNSSISAPLGSPPSPLLPPAQSRPLSLPSCPFSHPPVPLWSGHPHHRPGGPFVAIATCLQGPFSRYHLLVTSNEPGSPSASLPTDAECLLHLFYKYYG